MKRLFKNIGTLAGIVPAGVVRKEGAAMDEVGMIDNAWLLVEEGLIADFGDASRPVPDNADEVVDARGGMVMPAFCDSHTHIVYAGCRDGEFLDKINGLSYEEIAARGGGILNSSDLLHRTSEEELYRQSMERVGEMIAKGTGAIEIKSGYGLNPEGEMKMLRVIDRIRQFSPAVVRSTFLGAHAVGRGYTHEGYVDEVCRMMPEASALADFVDVFCEEGYGSGDSCRGALCVDGPRVEAHAGECAAGHGGRAALRWRGHRHGGHHRF